jgi:hypothetical protein
LGRNDDRRSFALLAHDLGAGVDAHGADLLGWLGAVIDYIYRILVSVSKAFLGG